MIKKILLLEKIRKEGIKILNKKYILHHKYNLNKKWTVLFSPVFGKISLEELANWILKDNLKVRLQLQMHKYIWDPDKRAV